MRIVQDSMLTFKFDVPQVLWKVMKCYFQPLVQLLCKFSDNLSQTVKRRELDFTIVRKKTQKKKLCKVKMWQGFHVPLTGRTMVKKVQSPVGQSLQDRGHQHPGDGVTHSHDVHHRRGAQDWQHVGGHALPEVEQEALDLNDPTNTMRASSTDDGKIAENVALASSKLARMTVSSIL